MEKFETIASNTTTYFEEAEQDSVENDSIDLDGEESEGSVKEDIDEGAEECSSRSKSTDFIIGNEVKRIIPPIRPSYFPYVPPYLNFCLHDEKVENLPPEIAKHLKWRLSTITPIVVRKTLENSGFRLLRKTVEWSGQWGKHMKAKMFRTTLKDYQKLNHLPGTFQIGRKDRLWRNVQRFSTKYGKDEFGFVPRTYILPQELKQLKQAWNTTHGHGTWIIKPPASARGAGIRVINKWNQIPKKKSVIVQKYIANPLLINDRKFDLRLYVLVTSYNPLRIYLYKDGLVRFASVKYSKEAKRVADRYMHLTNYSINKNCEFYTQNSDAEACKGSKWTLKTLWRYLAAKNVNTEQLWEKMEDIIIKTMISAEELITSASYNLPNRYTGYELFGFDILIDDKLKPWLLEVNISPSLHSSSPLDLAVKGPMVTEVFNIVGYHLSPKITLQARKSFLKNLDIELEQENPVFDKRLYSTCLSKEEKTKIKVFKSVFDEPQHYLEPIIEDLTPDDVRHIITSEDELSQCQGFIRIFPTVFTNSYFVFFENPRYYNMLLDGWEQKYSKNRMEGIERISKLCRLKYHYQAPPSNKETISETLSSNTGVGGGGGDQNQNNFNDNEQNQDILLTPATLTIGKPLPSPKGDNINKPLMMMIQEQDEIFNRAINELNGNVNHINNMDSSSPLTEVFSNNLSNGPIEDDLARIMCKNSNNANNKNSTASPHINMNGICF